MLCITSHRANLDQPYISFTTISCVQIIAVGVKLNANVFLCCTQSYMELGNTPRPNEKDQMGE